MNKRLFHAITTITFGGPKRTYSDWYNADTLRQAMRMHRAETKRFGIPGPRQGATVVWFECDPVTFKPLGDLPCAS